MALVRSKRYLQQARKQIAGGGSSHAYLFKIASDSSFIIREAKGSKICDLDNTVYTDYVLGGGVHVLGHVNRNVVLSVKKHAERGLGFGVTTKAEIDFSRYLLDHVPSMERLRFVNSGTEATLGAIRLSQVVTGRRNIVSFQGAYHGFHGLVPSVYDQDEMLKDPFILPYNDVAALTEAIGRQHGSIAGIILEPVMTHAGLIPARPAFLEAAWALSRKHKIFLIFDEVNTGFRGKAGCVHTDMGITPDITCLGSVIGGGFPIGAYGGRADVMRWLAPDGNVYQAGSQAANPVVLRAGMMALRLMDDSFFRKVKQNARALAGHMNRFFDEHHIDAHLTQWNGILHLRFSRQPVENYDQARTALRADMYGRLHQYLFSQGIYFPSVETEPFFLSVKHSKGDIQKLTDELKEFFLNR